MVDSLWYNDRVIHNSFYYGSLFRTISTSKVYLPGQRSKRLCLQRFDLSSVQTISLHTQWSWGYRSSSNGSQTSLKCQEILNLFQITSKSDFITKDLQWCKQQLLLQAGEPWITMFEVWSHLQKSATRLQTVLQRRLQRLHWVLFETKEQPLSSQWDLWEMS